MKMRNTPLVLYQMEILEVVNHMVYALGLFLTKMLALYLIMTDNMSKTIVIKETVNHEQLS